MPWVKLDDGFPDHPKVVGLSDRAFRTYVRSLCYSARFLTDGWLPGSVWTKAAGRAELVDAKLWEVEGAGFRVHDWAVYNPSGAEVKEARERRREGNIRGGKTRARSAERDDEGRFSPGSSPGFPPGWDVDPDVGETSVQVTRSTPPPVPVPVVDQDLQPPEAVASGTMDKTFRDPTSVVLGDRFDPVTDDPDVRYLLARVLRLRPNFGGMRPGYVRKAINDGGPEVVAEALRRISEGTPRDVNDPTAYLGSVLRQVQAERDG